MNGCSTLKLISDSNETNKKSIMANYIGQYVIVRTRNEGVNAGYLVSADQTGCILSDARRLYYHKPKDESQSWYEGVANSGLGSASKVSPPTKYKIIVEDYSITAVSEDAKKNIIEYKTNE